MKVTNDVEEIRRWAESKGGRPAHVRGTGRGEDPGVLRIDFPGTLGLGSLERMSWADWSRWFDKKQLALVFQPSSRFSRIVPRAEVSLPESARPASLAPAKRTSATPARAPGAKRATTGSKRTAAKRATPTSTTTKRAPAKRTTTRTTKRAPTKTATRTTRRTTKKTTTRRAPKRS